VNGSLIKAKTKTKKHININGQFSDSLYYLYRLSLLFFFFGKRAMSKYHIYKYTKYTGKWSLKIYRNQRDAWGKPTLETSNFAQKKSYMHSLTFGQR